MISKGETIILITIAVLYVCMVRYYHIAPISHTIENVLN
jgi:hypothetical protein